MKVLWFGVLSRHCLSYPELNPGLPLALKDDLCPASKDQTSPPHPQELGHFKKPLKISEFYSVISLVCSNVIKNIFK
jgi:hypothetical protein